MTSMTSTRPMHTICLNLKSSTLCLLIALITLSPLSYANNKSLRCGSRLVQINDLAIQVKERCGKPVSEEIIGYTLAGDYRYKSTRKREYKIEQWIYGPHNGFYKVITLEAGRVKRIESVKQ